MWKITALLLHILLLGSIFVIYFRSPVISGLRPQEENLHLKPPAKRLVLIVTDGLRADSFFKNECSDIPNIRNILLHQGIAGISRTRVPTESRPGHIALIAGLYEDPSAVTRGWKENPIDFDTVFNRSAKTYAWGANDVLSIFSKITADDRMVIDAYDHDLDFSGKDKTYQLDTWVFSKVKFFLDRKAKELQEQERVIFFLHLLGLDSAGHIHKPDSQLFLENLHITDRGVYEVYQHFEKVFPDQKTAYILTSDHGMTNSGSHGSGNPHETETPIFAWGAGVNNWSSMLPSARQKNKTFVIDEKKVPLYELEQAQITPLMAALIGLPPPMNNLGTLPNAFLNVSQEYLAQAVYTNSLQLIAQFHVLLEEFENGFFSPYMYSYDNMNSITIRDFRQRMQSKFAKQENEEIIETSYKMMQNAIAGIDYFHTYYKKILLLSTSMTFLGWMVYLLKLLSDSHDQEYSYHNFILSKSTYCLLSLALVFFILLLLQRTPFSISFYIILPVFVWMLPLQQNAKRWYGMKKSYSFFSNITLRELVKFLLLIVGAELIVASFFYRQLISLVFLFFALFDGYESLVGKGLKFFVWLLLVTFLTLFPLFPGIVVGQKNDTLLLCGVLMIFCRCFLIKSKISSTSKIASIIAVINAAICILKHNNQEGISVFSQIISWSYLVYSLSVPLFSSVVTPKQQVELILFNLTSLYMLLCTSFESIFVLLLGSQLILTCSSQQHTKYRKYICANSNNLSDSFRTAFAILLHTFFSFFGTGNIASVSSFDPNIIRCFLTTFSPFTIMALVVLKLVIPVMLNICIIFGITSNVEGQQLNERQIFICLLFICDVMGLNFLFLVQNQGSWLEIGSSISHFVIMEVTTLVLVILTYVAKILLRVRLRHEDISSDYLPHRSIEKFR